MASILLVNDEPDLLEICRMVLESEGHSVAATTDSVRARELAETADLVLLDLVMPGTTGEAVLRSFRESPKTRNVPVVVVSALEDARERAEAMGADGYMAKPFTASALFE